MLEGLALLFLVIVALAWLYARVRGGLFFLLFIDKKGKR